MRVALAVLFAGCGRIGFDGPSDRGDGPDAADRDDAIVPLGSCPGVLPSTLALYPFDSGPQDASGQHPALFAGSPASVPGPNECDTAVAFDGDVADHVVIPDSPAWDLPVASVSLWLRVRGSGEQGIIGRDAIGYDTDGHFGLLVDGGGRLGLRVQKGGFDSVVCSNAAVPIDQWMHVVMRFGSPGLELAIDGVVQTGTGELTIFDNGLCDTPMPWGLDGNDNPWAIGANTGRTGEGDLIGLDLPLVGDVDHVRISSSRD